MKFPSEMIPGLDEDAQEIETEAEEAPKNDAKMDEHPSEAKIEALCNDNDDEDTKMLEAEVAQVAPIEESTTAPVQPASESELKYLQGLLKYYTDGIKFIKQIESAVPLLCELLGSNSKAEVVEAIQFFMVAHRFDMECSKVCFLF